MTAILLIGTNNEFGFDYLRDNMAVDKEGQVQRGHNYAIVDEVDSVLIDEARTPLIISGPVDVDDQKFDEMKPRIERLYRMQKNFVAKIVAGSRRIINCEEKGETPEAGVQIIQSLSEDYLKVISLQKFLVKPPTKN